MKCKIYCLILYSFSSRNIDFFSVVPKLHSLHRFIKLRKYHQKQRNAKVAQFCTFRLLKKLLPMLLFYCTNLRIANYRRGVWGGVGGGGHSTKFIPTGPFFFILNKICLCVYIKRLNILRYWLQRKVPFRTKLHYNSVKNRNKRNLIP